MVRARDTGIPLVEVQQLALNDETTLKDVFGSDGVLIREILWSEGDECQDRVHGPEIELKTIGLSIPGHHSIALDGDYGVTIEAVSKTGSYSGYAGGTSTFGNPLEPIFSFGYGYEHDYGSNTSMFDKITEVRLLAGLAFRLDGAIDVEVLGERNHRELSQGVADL